MSNIRLFFSAALSTGMNDKLDKSQSHYLNKVMRVKENEFFSLFNSNGEWEAKVLSISKSIIEFKIIKQLRQKENIKKESTYKKYYYYDRDGVVNSEMSYFNVVTDPLQGTKNSLYVTNTQILYSTETQASHDGTGTISYTSKSLFSVGEINSVKITNIGGDYKKIPIVTGIIDNDGNIDTNVSCFLNSTDIGIPRNIKIKNSDGKKQARG